MGPRASVERRGSVEDHNSKATDQNQPVRLRVEVKWRVKTVLLDFFKFGAMVQAIAEFTKIPRVDLVKSAEYLPPGKEGYELISGYFIRDGGIDNRLEQQHPALYNIVSDFIEDRQSFPMVHDESSSIESKQWSELFGKISEYQAENLQLLAQVNFATYDEVSESAMNELMQRLDRLMGSLTKIYNSNFTKRFAEWIRSPETLYALVRPYFYSTRRIAKKNYQSA